MNFKQITNGIWILGKGNFYISADIAIEMYKATKSPNECNPKHESIVINGTTYYQVYATNVWD
jgi:hypothetical protein